MSTRRTLTKGKLSPERIREVVNSGQVESEKKTWKDHFKTLIGQTWNEGRRTKLKELWRACSDYYGLPKFNEPAKLRKLAALLNQFCDTKGSIPSKVADVVKLIEKEGLIDSVELLYGQPKYLGFVTAPTQADIFAGYFAFKVPVVKLYPRGYYFDKNGDRQREYQKKSGWGFFNLYLTGKTNVPHPQFKDEDAIDENWQEMKRNNKIITGNPKNIKIA